MYTVHALKTSHENHVVMAGNSKVKSTRLSSVWGIQNVTDSSTADVWYVVLCVCVRVPEEISVSLRCTVTMFGKSYPHKHTHSLWPNPLTMSTCSRAGFNQSQTTGSKFSHSPGLIFFDILFGFLYLRFFCPVYYVSSELKQNYLTPFLTGRTEDRDTDRHTHRHTQTDTHTHTHQCYLNMRMFGCHWTKINLQHALRIGKQLPFDNGSANRKVIWMYKQQAKCSKHWLQKSNIHLDIKLTYSGFMNTSKHVMKNVSKSV